MDAYNLFQVSDPYKLVVIIRYFILQVVCLEMARTSITIFGPIMPFCDVYIKCLSLLYKMSLSQYSFRFYQQLRCISLVGKSVFVKLGAAIMASVLVSMVAGNWVIIAGWSVLPKSIYFAIAGNNLVEYFVLFQTVPMLARINDLSSKILQCWKKAGSKSSYWKRVLKAQKPIAFYYGFTKFEKETTINYVANVVNNTVNVLILQN